MQQLKSTIQVLLLWAILYAGGSPISSAQERPVLQEQFWKVQNLGVNEGLSAGYIYKIVQDSLGFIWLATAQGLDRYDGYSIRKYEHGEDGSIPENCITHILVDSRGYFWLRTLNQKLVVFDQQSDRFATVDSLCGARDFREDPLGNIWYLKGEDEWQVVVPRQLQNPEMNLKQKVATFQIHSPGDLYPEVPKINPEEEIIVSRKNGIWWEDEDTLRGVFPVKLYGKPRPPVAIPIPLRTTHVRYIRLIEDFRQDNILFFTRNEWTVLDPFSGKKLRSLPTPEINEEFSPIILDAKGRIILRTIDKEFVLKPQTNEWFELFQKNDALAEKVPLTGICIQDKNQIIWFNTSGLGANKYLINLEKIGSWGSYQKRDITNELYGFGSNKICFRNGGMLFLFDPEKGKPEQLWAGAQNKGMSFVAVFERKDGKYWVSGHQEREPSIWLYNPQDNQFTPKPIPTETAKITQAKQFVSKDQSLWSVSGLAPKLAGTTQFQILVQKLYTADDLPAFEVRGDRFNADHDFMDCKAMYEDNQGKLWMGFSNGGILTYHPKTRTWEHIFHQENDSLSLSDDQVYSFLPDPHYPDSIFWVGTSRGLNKMNIARKTFTHYTTEHGLPNNVVYAIIPDDHGNFWISTNQGICLFNPQSLSVRSFTQKNGLEFNEFNSGSHFRTENGTIFFGGIGGLIWFNPEDFYQSEIAAPTRIIGLRLRNKPIRYNPNKKQENGEFILEKPIEFTRHITLSYDERIITFEFATMNFGHPSQNKFRYRLLGFNNDWIYSNQQNEATYTNLAPGKYTFQVQGQTPDEQWNENTAEMEVLIRPPYWKTWWFVTCIISLFFLIIFLIIRNRFRQRKRIEDLRNHISKDLHDEIGSTLSSISMYGIVAQKNIPETSTVANQLLAKINQSTQEIMEAMNDIVWAIKSDNDKMEDMVNRMHAFATHLGKARDWRVKFEYDDTVRNYQIGMIARRNVYLIFKEAVNNAMKYSRGNLLQVDIEGRGKEITITIQDNGKGFDPQMPESSSTFGGNGLPNMNRRATEIKGKLKITSVPNVGTTIILTFNPHLAAPNH